MKLNDSFQTTSAKIAIDILTQIKINGRSLEEWLDTILGACCEHTGGAVDRHILREQLNKIYNQIPETQRPALLQAIEALEAMPTILENTCFYDKNSDPCIEDNVQTDYRGMAHDGTWVYGQLLYGDNHAYIVQSKNKWTSVLSDTVGRNTGIMDKNGRQIYEGDTVNGMFLFGLRVPGRVIFKNGSFGLQWPRGISEEFTAFTSICNMEFEVMTDELSQ